MADDTGLQAVLEDFSAGVKSLGEAVVSLKTIKENQDKHDKQIPDPDAYFKTLVDKIDEAVEAKVLSLAEAQALKGRPGDIDGEAAEKAHPFTSFGNFLFRAKAAGGGELVVDGKAWGAGGSAGGYLIPEEYRAELLRLPLEDEVVRSRARVLPMTTDTLKMPALDQSTQASTLFGGVLGYWVGMGVAPTATNPTFTQVELSVEKLATATIPPYEILADSNIGVQSLLGELLGEGTRYMEDEAYLTGDAASKPQGVIGSACEVAATRTGAGHVVTADILNMFAKHLFRGGGSVWVANQTTIPDLASLADAGSHNLMVLNIANGLPMTILGVPIVFTEKVPALGTKGDIGLYNFKFYLIGDRQDMRAEWSTHVQFLEDNLDLKVVDRVDGVPWMASSYTPRKGNPLSPFTMLTT